LNIADLSLLTSGVHLITQPLPILLPPLSAQTVRVTCIAPQAGTLHLRGVGIRLHDGSHTEVLLPMMDDADLLKAQKRRSRMSAELSKTKRSGMEARLSVMLLEGVKHGRKSSVSVPQKWLECTVVDEQPLLWIRSTSLTHGTIMLYHGESSTIRLSLDNSSSTPVNFLKLSFDDSTQRDAQVILQEGELSPEQAYELDWDQIHNPVFSWEAPDQTIIPPNGRLTLCIKCFGKVGCTDGNIRIDYGHVVKSNDDKSFFTRHLDFPVLFTVYHTLESHSLDLTRLLPSPSLSSPETKSNGSIDQSTAKSSTSHADDILRSKLGEESDNAHCLVSLDVRNVYGVPFEVSIGRTGDNSQTSRLVPPGATERLILPIPRIRLLVKDISRPIPILTERQYVVDKRQISQAETKRKKEMFWYREQLLNLLFAKWVEPGSLRSGKLNLRHLHLSSEHLGVFRKDDLDLILMLHQNDKPCLIARTCEKIDLSLKIINRLERSFRPLMRIESLPSSSSDSSWASIEPTVNRRYSIQPHVSRNILMDGSQMTILPLLEPDGRADHTISIIFLASGTYSFRGAVEEILPDDGEETKVRFSPLLIVKVEE
ncbi:hypothetical protein TREMEDRAFT_26647, partial [Tremella mesenterica DSM 1558]|uniref:uncharacterized protein n=1 Tax=Tremella mesenterica (strain ATCC 24925 / CBS 8224 / DSM 1558 / NBRC 9311 / NRRL Y-6157 / RJB 2259-6 / UBC 559-6) TaxID=578456 RepID=UPI0003F48D23